LPVTQGIRAAGTVVVLETIATVGAGRMALTVATEAFAALAARLVGTVRAAKAAFTTAVAATTLPVTRGVGTAGSV
jgi:hypothetical protein